MRIVIAGAGIVGTTTAWRAAQAGHEVTVVDDRAPGAWQVAAGMLAATSEVAAGEADRVRLAAAGAQRWHRHAAELARAGGTDLDLGTGRTLLVARTDDDLAVLRETLAVRRDLGVDVTPLRARACREREPGLHPRIRGGVLTDDRHVDPRRVVTAARAAATAAGARFLTGAVAALDPEVPDPTAPDATVRGARLADGTWVDADVVVLAGGWRSGRIDGVPTAIGDALRPVKGQLLVLGTGDGSASPVRATVRAIVRGRPLYLVPRVDGRLVVGATEEERGDDTTVTAGGVRTLLDAAVDLAPGIDELQLHEMLAGLRPGTVDGRPLIGPTARPGLLVASGHHRDGVLLSLLTAEAIVDHLAGRAPDPAVTCADPGRLDHTARGGPAPAGAPHDPDSSVATGGTRWN